MSIFTRYILEECENKHSRGYVLEAPEDEDNEGEDESTEDDDSGTDYGTPSTDGEGKEDEPTDDTDTDDNDNDSADDNPDDEGTDDSTDGEEDAQDNEGDSEEDEDDFTMGDAEGDGDDEGSGDGEPTDDEGDDSGEETEDEEPDTVLSKIENSLFENLSAKQKEIKISALKKDYSELNNRIDKLYDMFNNSTAPSNVEYAIFENIKTYLLSLNQLVYDYFTNTFDTKDYLENNIQYQKFLLSLNQINSLLDELKINKE